jgi:hypothetical protein
MEDIQASRLTICTLPQSDLSPLPLFAEQSLVFPVEISKMGVSLHRREFPSALERICLLSLSLHQTVRRIPHEANHQKPRQRRIRVVLKILHRLRIEEGHL